MQLAVKCKLQIRFVIDSINNASMKGQTITTILTKLLQIERLLEYFSTFVSDCFGDNSTKKPLLLLHKAVLQISVSTVLLKKLYP